LRGQGAAVRIGQPLDEDAISRQALLDGVRDAEVLLCLLTERIDREVLEANPALLGIANYAVGHDNIDLAAASQLGIPVTNTPGVLTEATADFTWALLLALARRIPEGHRHTVAGNFRIWGPNLFLGADVGPGPDGEPRTLGIVGYGRIGQAVARRAQGFEMEVLAYDPPNIATIEQDPGVRAADLLVLLRTSDFVTLHTALTPGTHHLIGEPELRAMKPTAFLINAARGPIIDERALVTALRERWIAGAALDVYEREPVLADGLASLPNVVLTPHMASATTETRSRMATIAATNAIAHLRRERAPDCVNPAVYDSDRYRRRVGL
jgi:glyoxylate reductase